MFKLGTGIEHPSGMTTRSKIKGQGHNVT